MELFHQIILIVTGLYLLIGALTMQTKNILSSMLFKVTPFFLGMGCLFAAGKLIGWY